MSEMKTVRYYIDCSRLPISEYETIYKMIDNESFMCNPDERSVRCFSSVWLHPDVPPDKFFYLPDGCIVRKI